MGTLPSQTVKSERPSSMPEVEFQNSSTSDSSASSQGACAAMTDVVAPVILSTPVTPCSRG